MSKLILITLLCLSLISAQSRESDFLDFLSFISVSGYPVTPDACTNGETHDSIKISDSHFESKPAKGSDISITMVGTMTEYQDLKNVQVTTVLAGVIYPPILMGIISRNIQHILLSFLEQIFNIRPNWTADRSTTPCLWTWARNGTSSTPSRSPDSHLPAATRSSSKSRTSKELSSNASSSS